MLWAILNIKFNHTKEKLQGFKLEQIKQIN